MKRKIQINAEHGRDLESEFGVVDAAISLAYTARS
jgi:hypothetical protein